MVVEEAEEEEEEVSRKVLRERKGQHAENLVEMRERTRQSSSPEECKKRS
jgi:riboflavin synthase